VDPVEYVENIYAEDEAEIVRAALQRGVVRTIATISVDELLKPQEGGTRAIAERARLIAQETLDAMNSGIRIEQFEMSRRTPPGSLRQEFRAVLDARSQAQTAITEARAERDRLLNEAAGEAAETLLWLISRYEVAVEAGASGEAAELLSRIDRVFEGEPISVSERDLASIENPARREAIARSTGRLASGRVVQIISGAKVNRETLVQEARGDLVRFRAKLSQFEANPGLMVSRDWSGAWRAFQSRDFVQSMLLPTGLSAELRINEDPDIVKQLDRARKQRETQEAIEERRRLQDRSRIQVDRGEVIEDR